MASSIFLVRHSETEWSASGKHTSRTDLPLTEAGRRRAAELAPSLGRQSFALVLSSPLLRARETCSLAGLSEEAEISEDLREWDYGAYEGLTTPEIRTERPDWVLWRDGCPDGESPPDLGRRVDAVLADLRQAGGQVALFAHGHVLRVLTARWLGLGPENGSLFVLATGTLSVLGFERETAAIRVWNAREPLAE
jgi:probable phosphoglycerate mutase